MIQLKYQGLSNDNDRERAKAAFLYHTPLNEKLAPLLDVSYLLFSMYHCVAVTNVFLSEILQSLIEQPSSTKGGAYFPPPSP